MQKPIFLFTGVLIFGICINSFVIADNTKRKINSDDLTKEDLDVFLESILSRREKDATVENCDFEEVSGVILRTHDSLANGAKFISAPDYINTEPECKKACCNNREKNGTLHCDLAVFQKQDDDPSDDQPRCFLFSCFLENRTDICVLSPNSDYKVLKRKYEVAEKQLIDVAAEKKESSNKETESENKQCAKQFKKTTGKIIRTQDSITNGAEFLMLPKNIETVEQCEEECCSTVSDKTSRHCDFAVFQQKKDESQSDKPRCYLFSCTDHDGKFKCLTSLNADYVTLQRTLDVEENQLIDMATSLASKTETISTTSTLPIKTLMSTTTTTTSTTVSSASILENELSSTVHVDKSCGRLDWKCDDGSCVKVTDVCNGKYDCLDHSDEGSCEGLGRPDTKDAKTIEEEPEFSTSEALHVTSVSVQESTVATTTIPKILPSKITSNSEIEIIENELEFESVGERTAPQKGAVLPLALGLSVTACVLLMVGCRLHIMKKKLRRRGKPLSMEESDYLINGMYL
ncbi:low-density lipoprotein receptor-related protein 11-like [Styela clava]